jgi:hypothetical protein
MLDIFPNIHSGHEVLSFSTSEDTHSTTSFALSSDSDPTASERVIFLPGGKTMVVDLGIQSFVKNIVSVTIAGVVVLGATAYGLVWAEKKLKRRPQQVRVARRKEPVISDSEEYVNSSQQTSDDSEGE